MTPPIEPRPEASPEQASKAASMAGASMASVLLACWPLTLQRVANELGISLAQLRAFLHQQTPLPQAPHRKLLRLLRLERQTTAVGEAGLVLRPHGYYVLCARSSERAALNAYKLLAGEGDGRLCLEVLSDLDAPDPAWRFVLLSRPQPFHPHLIVFRRDHPATALLSGERLPHFQGQITVHHILYRAVVAVWEYVQTNPWDAHDAARILTKLDRGWQAVADALRTPLPLDDDFRWP